MGFARTGLVGVRLVGVRLVRRVLVGEYLDAVELEESLVGVGGPVLVGGGRRQEPVASLVAALHREQEIRVRVPEPRRPRLDPAPVETGALQGHQGRVELAQVAASAGLDDAHLRLGGRRQRLRPRGLRQPERPVGAAERPLGVGEQRQRRVVTGHPAGGAQLGDRLGPLPRRVGRLADGLPDHCDPGAQRACGSRLRESGLRVVVDEPAGGDQVPGYPVGDQLAQRAQLRAHLGREVARVGVGGRLHRRTRSAGAAHGAPARFRPRTAARSAGWPGARLEPARPVPGASIRAGPAVEPPRPVGALPAGGAASAVGPPRAVVGAGRKVAVPPGPAGIRPAAVPFGPAGVRHVRVPLGPAGTRRVAVPVGPGVRQVPVPTGARRVAGPRNANLRHERSARGCFASPPRHRAPMNADRRRHRACGGGFRPPIAGRRLRGRAGRRPHGPASPTAGARQLRLARALGSLPDRRRSGARARRCVRAGLAGAGRSPPRPVPSRVPVRPRLSAGAGRSPPRPALSCASEAPGSLPPDPAGRPRVRDPPRATGTDFRDPRGAEPAALPRADGRPAVRPSSDPSGRCSSFTTVDPLAGHEHADGGPETWPPIEEECPATSYSPTRSPAQYHRRRRA